MSLICLVLAMCCGCATRPEEGSSAVRLRFVPVGLDSADHRPASWSALHPAPNGAPGVEMAMAHAGVGDSFPVQEKDGRILFEVKVAGGDDDCLQLEIRTDESVEPIELPRDQPVSRQIGGSRFEFGYPTVTVGPDAKTTTSQAMILVHRFSAENAER